MAEEEWFNVKFNFKWKKHEVELYKRLQAQNDCFAGLKNGITGVTLFLLVLVWSFGWYYPIQNKDIAFNPIWYSILLFVWVLIHIISMVLHWAVYHSIIRKSGDSYKKHSKLKKKNNLKNLTTTEIFRLILRFLISIVKFLLSPDYFWAEHFKRRIGSHCSQNDLIGLKQIEFVRLLKRFYIERCNWANLSITMIVVPLLIIFLGGGKALAGVVPYALFLLIAVRSLSRTMEILIAFYNDVLKNREKIFFKTGNKAVSFNNDNLYMDLRKMQDNLRILNHHTAESIYVYPWKNSLLLPTTRASLAIHSLLEIIIIYGLLYFLMGGVSDYLFQNLDQVMGLGELPEGLRGDLGFIKYFIFSFSVAATLPDIKASYWAIPQFLQIFSSLVLIIMSLAYYLGKDHEMKDHERQLYKERANENIKKRFLN